MKFIEKVLLFLYLLAVLGLVNRFFNLSEILITPMLIGFLGILLVVPIYTVISFVKKQNRMNAVMLLSALPAIISLCFTSMRWEGGSILIMISTAILSFLSIILLSYSIISKRYVLSAILFLGIGFGSLFYCFKTLSWDFSDFLIIPMIICLFVAVFVKVKQAIKLEICHFIMLSVIGLLLVYTFFK